MISGSNSGTTTLAALTVTGATTLTGAVSGTNASNDIRGILLQATQSGVTIPTVTTVTNQVTAAQNATAIWTDLLASSDFSTALSIGKLIKDNLPAAVGPTAAAIATAVWTDLLASTDFATALSIGKKLSDLALGSDSKVILSADAHTGAVVPTVTTVTNDVGITQAGADKVFGASGAALPELTSAPSDTPSPRQALMHLFMWRAQKADADDGTNLIKMYDGSGTVIAKRTKADTGVVATRQKWVNGP